MIAGWWLLFAPKVVRTLGKCFSFRGSRVALNVVQNAGWWLSFAPKVVRTCGRVFFFSWFPCGTESGTHCWMVAFICTESGTDYRKVFFFSWFPCGTEGGTDCWMVAFICTRKWYGQLEGVFFFRGSRVALKVVHIAGGFCLHRKWYGLLECVFLSVVPVWH